MLAQEALMLTGNWELLEILQEIIRMMGLAKPRRLGGRLSGKLTQCKVMSMTKETSRRDINLGDRDIGWYHL